MTKERLHDAYIRLRERGYRPPSGREYDDPKVLATARRIEIDIVRRNDMIRRHGAPFVRFKSVESGASDPLQTLIRREESEWVHTELGSMDQKSRAVTELRYFDGASIAKIAILTGDTMSAVNSRLARVRRSLRDRWSE